MSPSAPNASGSADSAFGRTIPIVVRSNSVLLGDVELGYYPYYYQIRDDKIDHRTFVIEGLNQFATDLHNAGDEGSKAYFPYSPDDEATAVLIATRVGTMYSVETPVAGCCWGPGSDGDGN